MIWATNSTIVWAAVIETPSDQSGAKIQQCFGINQKIKFFIFFLHPQNKTISNTDDRHYFVFLSYVEAYMNYLKHICIYICT